MRLRAGSSLLYPLVVAVTLGTGLLVGAGCGGGSSNDPRPGSIPSGTASATPTPIATATPVASPLTVRSVIIWGGRSRQTTTSNAVSGPSSGLSAVISLLNPANGSEAFSQVVNRDVQEGRQQYTSPSRVSPGVYNLVVRFFAGRDGAGQVVGTAAASTSVIADITTADPNDATLSTTIATFGTIQNITIPAGQTVAIGQTKSVDLATASDLSTVLIYEPKDAAGNLIAVSPGSAFVTAVDTTSTVAGQPSIRTSGDTVTGLAPQRATITIKVDDAVSAASEISVASGITPGGTFRVTASSTDISILQTVNLTSSISNDGPAGSNGVTYSILDNGDGSKGTVTPAGVFTSTRFEGTVVIRATSVYDPRVFVDTRIVVSSKVAVTLTPANPAPISFRGGQLRFTSSVTNVPDGQDAGVTYSVREQSGGTITPEGLYSAPAAPGVYTVVATSNFDTRKFAEVKVTVQSLATVAITPNPVTNPISIRSNLQFTATVGNVPDGQDMGVNWSVAQGAAGGQIDATGLYSSPVAEGDYTIVATSRFDPTKTATVVVRVRSFAQVTINPADVQLSIRASQQFTVNVTGIPPGGDQGVAYTVEPANGGSITATGFYTAPATPGDYVVVARSLFDPNKVARATVRVRSFVTVAVTPETATMNIKDRLQVSTVVGGVPAGQDVSVRYTLEAVAGTPPGTPLGSVDPVTGLYTSPSNEVDVIVRATSNFDPTKSAVSRIAVRSLAVVRVDPAGPLALSIQAVQAFSATVDNLPASAPDAERGVEFSLRDAAGNLAPAAGTLNVTGPTTVTYTAGGAEGTFFLRATSRFDPAKFTQVTLTLTSRVVFTPATLPAQQLTINGQRNFGSIVTVNPGLAGASTALTWSVRSSGAGNPVSTINATTGLLRAGATTETVIVRATSVFDPNKFIEFTLRIVSGSGSVIIE